MLSFTITCLALVACVKGQFDGCETLTLPSHEDLELQPFMGSWYVLKTGTRLASQMRPSDWTCHESVLSDSGTFNIMNFQDRFFVVENGTVIGPGTADYKIGLGELNPENPNAVWNIYHPEGTQSIGQSLIIATDPYAWALEYVCFGSDNPVGRLSFWSRRRYLEPLVEKTLHTIADSLGFPRENFLDVEHSEC